jgi:hypothetical protein
MPIVVSHTRQTLRNNSIFAFAKHQHDKRQLDDLFPIHVLVEVIG